MASFTLVAVSRTKAPGPATPTGVAARKVGQSSVVLVSQRVRGWRYVRGKDTPSAPCFSAQVSLAGRTPGLTCHGASDVAGVEVLQAVTSARLSVHSLNKVPGPVTPTPTVPANDRSGASVADVSVTGVYVRGKGQADVR